MINGKRTYIVGALAILDLAGVYLGFWEYDEKRLTAYGAGGLMALRSGIAKAEAAAAASQVAVTAATPSQPSGPAAWTNTRV